MSESRERASITGSAQVSSHRLRGEAEDGQGEESEDPINQTEEVFPEWRSAKLHQVLIIGQLDLLE